MTAKNMTARERTLAAQGKTSKPEGVLRFSVDGQTFDVDPRTLTIRESHVAKTMLAATDYPPDFHFRSAATAWVIARRTCPELDFESVLDQMTIGDILDAEQNVEDPDSPEA